MTTPRTRHATCLYARTEGGTLDTRCGLSRRPDALAQLNARQLARLAALADATDDVLFLGEVERAQRCLATGADYAAEVRRLCRRIRNRATGTDLARRGIVIDPATERAVTRSTRSASGGRVDA